MKLFDDPQAAPEIFWAEMPPCNHVVQIYENDAVFLDTLEQFAAGGLRAGEAVVVIATRAHRDALSMRLAAGGIDVEALASNDQLMLEDAEELLAKFMLAGWPDDEKFKRAVGALLARASRGGRRVRAFGEMVALLWGAGHCAATVRLEHLWHALCEEARFTLLCSYPKAGFTRNASESIREICNAHSHVLGEHAAAARETG
ncbi:MEDS domain-containing protein [Ramlibacter albus]|uniref:MEDS domain-containing protein n=1 Tax=Ramlibacter albus TaxID=2079448 RepID=A0A923S5F8_9BURK|nr:MEDS domain-containing protein [Ramlibacter albus]MBC5768574.1 MEDS domain-containing protein [Ramlibacter albus]